MRTGIFAILFFVVAKGFCQSDTVTKLSVVTIKDNQLNTFFNTVKTVRFDSLYLTEKANTDVGSLLSAKGVSFIKSYGPMQLQSLSIGGLNTNQTAVCWEGISLNDAMLGSIDLSLLPVTNFNDILLITGGTSTMSGGNSIGGTVALHTNLHFNDKNKIVASSEFSTLNNWQNNLAVKYSKNKFATTNSITVFNGKNHVRYKRLVGRATYATDTLEHAEYKGSSFISNNLIKLAKNQTLQVNLWYQKFNRNIPPTLVEAISDAIEYDEQIRGLMEYNWMHTHSITTIKLAGFKTYMWYNDTIKATDSHNATSSYYLQASNKWVFHKSSEIFVRGEWQKQLSETNNYLSPKYRNTMALVAGYRQPFMANKIKTNLSVRFENVNYQISPIVFNTGSLFKITNALSAKLNAACNYRLPTLNDMYWNPYGNPDLKAEKGYGYQGGLAYRFTKSKWQLKISSTSFNNRVINLIVWTPISPTFWQPKNVGKVNAYGLMNDLTVTYKTNIWFMRLDVDHIFTRSINNDTNDINYRKQLLYIPKNQIKINGFIAYKGWMLTMNQQVISKSYTSYDNRSFIEGFTLTDIALSKVFKLRFGEVKLLFGVDNLFNSDYQLMINRSMPLRYYKASIQLTIK